MIDAWTEEDVWPGGTDELLIVGPPGTGKTTKVLRQYVWPAMRAGEVVLATSYTRAAAMELRERTAHELGATPETYAYELSTIHSEASRRCRGLGFKLHGQDRLEAQDDDVVPSGGDPHLVEIASRINEESARTGLTAWDRTRNLYPDDIGRPIRDRLARVGLYGSELDAAVVTVTRDMHERYHDGVLVSPDFTQLLEEAIQRGAQRDLDLLCVDEVQDLSPLQWALVDVWARRAKRLLLVGDPDQSIYGYAGADGRRLLAWLREGRCARRLAQSHRVPRAPHRFARRVIRQVIDREDAPYLPADRDGIVRHVHGDVAWYAVADAQDRGDEVFVLSRSRAGAAGAVDDLERLDIPHMAERGRKLLGSPGAPSVALDVADALADLAAGVALTPTGARRLVAALSTTGLPMRHGAKAELVALVKDRRSRIPIDDMEEAGLPTDALVTAWRRKDLTGALLPRVVSASEVVHVGGWRERLGEKLIAVAAQVVVTTAHGSKGRQADVVVVDARACFRGHRTAAQIDEDRRVLYVAVTRTKRDLVLLRGERGRDWLDAHGITGD